MHLPRTISLQLFEKVWVSCTATQELQIIPKKLLKILVPCLGCSSFNGQVNWKSQTCEQKKKEPTLGSNWLLTSIQNFYWEITWVSTKSVRIFEINNEILSNLQSLCNNKFTSPTTGDEKPSNPSGSSPWWSWPHPTGIHPVADLNEISEPPQQNGSFSPSVVPPTKYKMQYIDIYWYIYILQYLSISSNRFLSMTFFWDSWVVFQLFQKFSDLHLRESMVFTGSWLRLSDQIASLPKRKRTWSSKTTEILN